MKTQEHVHDGDENDRLCHGGDDNNSGTLLSSMLRVSRNDLFGEFTSSLLILMHVVNHQCGLFGQFVHYTYLFSNILQRQWW